MQALPEEQPEEPPPSITAEEVEAIRQAAWEEGCAMGARPVLPRGLEEGKLEGLQQGHQAGLEQGRKRARHGAGAGGAGDSPLASPGLTPGHPLARWTRRWSSSSSPWCNSSPAPSSAMRRKPPHAAAGGPQAGGWPCSRRRAGVTLMLHPEDVTRVEAAFGAEECARRHWRLQSEPTFSPAICNWPPSFPASISPSPGASINCCAISCVTTRAEPWPGSNPSCSALLTASSGTHRRRRHDGTPS